MSACACMSLTGLEKRALAVLVCRIDKSQFSDTGVVR